MPRLGILGVIIKRKVLVSMIFIGLSMLGYISYKKLPVELFPNVELPILIIQVNSTTDVDPKYMEQQAIIPLEGAVGTLEGVSEINSTATSQQGMIFISLDEDVNIKYAYLKLEQKISNIKANIGQDFIVNLIKIDTEQLTNVFMNVQVLGSGGVDRVRNITDRYIINRLANIDGMGGVEVFGGREKTVEIIMDDELCEANGITPNTINDVLSRNSNQSAFAGIVRNDGNRVFVNVTAELKDIKNIQNLVVSENGPLMLRDVADVYFGVKEQTSLSRVNGKDAVSLRLSRDTRANVIALSETTEKVIEEINKDLEPLDAELVIQSNTAEVMIENIDQIKSLALLGGILAVFVLWVFLRRIKFILSIALAIPISVFTAFNLFYAYNISVNSLTLIGMALAIGMLLDNSIVVIENIYRHLANKKPANVAVVDGTKEVMRSVIAATLTTVTVFLPFVFSSNFLITVIGSHVGISIISTLIVSLVVALLLIPMLAHASISKTNSSETPLIQNSSIRQRIIQVYVVVLKACFRKPALTLIGGVFLFFVTIGLSLIISFASLNEVENKELKLYVTMPEGSTLENTDLKVRSIEEKVMAIPAVEKVISQISESSSVVSVQLVENFNDLDTITMVDMKNRLNSISNDYEELDISLDKAPATTTGARGPSNAVNFERLLGLGSNTERIVIKGQDFDLMEALANDINIFVNNLQSIEYANVNVSPSRPEAHLIFNQMRMSDLGVTQANVATGLNDFQPSFTSGSRFVSGNEEYEITIRTDKKETPRPKGMKDLTTMDVVNAQGVKHQLSDFSNAVYSSGDSEILRVNQEKQIEITYQFIPEVIASKELLEASRVEIDQIVGSVNVPSGINVDVLHEEALFDEFYFLIVAALILILMILASVFESIYLPFVIMFTIPLSAIGAFLGLTLTGNSLLNANTLVGFLILLGVVVNNGIILIDYSRILRRRGYSKYRSLMVSGISRLRPILITSITTIVAMLPLAMGKAEYVVNIGQPFAITVMGGLAFSTILTLVYIPTMSISLENIIAWFRNLSPIIKIIQFALLGLITFFVYTEINGLLWKMIWFMSGVLLIPGATYFVMTALKQANSRMIKEGELMNIEIQHLTKVYGRDNRLVREWKGNKKLYDERGERKVTWRLLFENLIWQIAVAAFLIYFIYFFLNKAVWQLIFMFVLHGLLIYIINELIEVVGTRRRKMVKVFKTIIYWAFPIISSAYLYADIVVKAQGITLIILWFIGLILVSGARRQASNPVKPEAVKGRFKFLKRIYYRILGAIPFVGRKKEQFKALKGVDISIGQGMFGLLGPNGAGKTTLMRILCGIIDQSYGKIWINGHDTKLKREELQGLIGYLPQSFGTYENMTPYQFLDFQAILRKITNKKEREDRIQYVLKAVHMDEHQDKKIGSFSGGMKQRIGIAQILLHLPKILVVDEPTAGLDPLERIRFRNLLVELSRERIVVFSTHIIEDIASSCNNLAVLIKGSIEYKGSPASMAELARDKVWEIVIPEDKFEEVKDDYLIVHHMREGNSIRIKCLSETKPDEAAKQVKANLEDAYLWLIKSKSNNIHGELSDITE